MKLTKCELRSKLGDVSKRIDDAVEEIFSVYDVLDAISKITVTEEEYIKENGELGTDYDYYQLAVLEEYLDIPDLPTLQFMVDAVCCKNPIISRRLKEFMNYHAKFKEFIEDIVGLYIPLDSEKLKELKELLHETFGNLVYTLYYQFDLDITSSDIDNKVEDIRVDKSIYQYVNSKGISLSNLVFDIKAYLEKYPPKMPVFDKHPELEEEFLEIAGPHIKDYDALSEFITEEEVTNILAHKTKINVAEYINDIESKIKVEDTKKGLRKLDVFK